MQGGADWWFTFDYYLSSNLGMTPCQLTCFERVPKHQLEKEGNREPTVVWFCLFGFMRSTPKKHVLPSLFLSFVGLVAWCYLFVFEIVKLSCHGDIEYFFHIPSLLSSCLVVWLVPWLCDWFFICLLYCEINTLLQLTWYSQKYIATI